MITLVYALFYTFYPLFCHKMLSVTVVIVLSLLNCITGIERICPSGSVFVDSFAKCYSFLKIPTDWANAEEQCHSLYPDGHLVSISSAFENNFVIGNCCIMSLIVVF